MVFRKDRSLVRYFFLFVLLAGLKTFGNDVQIYGALVTYGADDINNTIDEDLELHTLHCR